MESQDSVRKWPWKRIKRIHTSQFQNLLQSNGNQNIMLLAQEQTQIPVKQNKEPRNKPIHLWSTDLKKNFFFNFFFYGDID